MADNLDLAIRIRADLKSALDKLDEMEQGVKKIDGEMKKIPGSAGGASSSVNKLGGSARKAGQEMRKASLGARVLTSTVGQLVRGDLYARGLVSIARALQRMTVETVQAGIDAESLADRMGAAFGSVAQAGSALAFVDAEATRLGISLAAAESGFAGLAAAARGTRLEGEATRDIFSAVAESARALNLSVADQAGVLRAFEQIISKGVVSAEELRGQLGERLPGIFQAAARALGVTTAELDRMLRRGDVLAEELLPLLATELRRTFGPGAIEAAEGPAAAFVKLDNELLKLQRTVSQSTGVLDFLSDMAVLVANVASATSGFIGPLFGAPREIEYTREAYNAAREDFRKTVEEIEALHQQLAESAQVIRDEGIDYLDLNETALGRSLAEAEDRLAIIRELLLEIAPHRRLPAAPTRPAFLVGDDEGEAGFAATTESTAARRAAALAQQLITSRALTHEERVRAELKAGILAGDLDEIANLISKAKALDEFIAAEAAAAEAAKAAAEARAEIQAFTADEIDKEAAGLERLAALRHTLADEQASLAGPYVAALHAAEQWRDEQSRIIEALAAEGHATEQLGATVEQIYHEKIAAAVRDASDASADAAEAASRAATDWHSGVTRGIRDLQTELHDFATLGENAVTGAFRGMEDAIVRFASTGKASFRDFAQSVIADLVRLQIRQSVTLPLFNWFSGLFGGSNAVLPGNPHSAHTGGIAGALSTYRTGIPAAAFAGAGRFHRGGFPGLSDDEIPVIVQRGEGIFTPEQMRALGASIGPAPRSVDVRIDNRGTPQTVQQAAPRIDADRLVIDIVTEDIARGGRISRVLATQGA